MKINENQWKLMKIQQKLGPFLGQVRKKNTSPPSEKGSYLRAPVELGDRTVL